MGGAVSGPASATSHFRVAFRVLPPARREGLAAVYAFCRGADDAVDEAAGPGDARARLAEVRRQLDDAFAGRTDDPSVAPLVRAIAAFSLPRKPFDDLLEGVTWDLEGRRYADAEALTEYCRRVASTVGLLCVRVFGCEGAGADAYAVELGVALQWTNILRDVGEDLARDRIYLPADALGRHGISEEGLRRRDAAARRGMDALVREEATCARKRFDGAQALLPDVDRRRLLAARIMAAVYRALLAKVERAGSGVLDRSPRVPAAQRALIALGLLLGDRMGRRG
jgi:phytoene synthase